MKAPISESTHDGAGLPGAVRLTVVVGILLVLAFGIIPQHAVQVSAESAESFVGTALDRVASGLR
jgi:hypothetical protein